MSTVVLVHGAWHGAWCWELLVPELERRGHRAIVVDLPCDDRDATLADYADVVAEAMNACSDGDTVVVGHSLAGHVLPLVAARRPVSRLVFLCAMVPDPGRSQAQQERDEDLMDPRYLSGLSRADGCTSWSDLDLAREMFYADCPDDVAAAAAVRLRPQSYGVVREVWTDPLPAVPSTYIVCTEDRMVYPSWSRQVAVERLGADLVELPGGHSPFLSRPEALAEVLDGLA
ncbi:alpha/beta fold hydrolase [Mycolicibacterium confluentis]|uniref:Uncharacterized protein n=1 Tax=Mycolicibacterium confluentis TaxID=28047 RepID=A0A7I7XZF6_9MYCO|nr:alpha/beta hydrolase [Mycolicibacterium confluentis]MCV7317751.1 alpha/beta hydrolase [Mycolicibacterium confluentis]ORV28186.1 hypothetical protein AWB99_18565 [Mycolicibacterium confluentis]BBZ34202.1 hypothetical protein MCNF_28070 [Mycolicibacterium confluentis]